jgi:hypothetical protein
MTRRILRAAIAVLVANVSWGQAVDDRAAVVIDVNGRGAAIRRALSDIKLDSHQQYRLVLRKKDYAGLTQQALMKLGKVEDTPSELRVEPIGSETTESIERRLKASGLALYRKEPLPGRLAVYVPRQLEDMYSWHLQSFAQGQSPKPPCPDCMGTGEATGPLVIPEKPVNPGPLNLRAFSAIDGVEAFVTAHYKSKGANVTVTKRSDSLLVAEIGPVRDHILTNQKMCEMITLSISVHPNGATVTTTVSADGRFKNRDDGIDCPTLAGQYTSHGTDYKAEEDGYAQRMANLITQHLGTPNAQ